MSNADSEIDPLDAYMDQIAQKSGAGGEVGNYIHNI